MFIVWGKKLVYRSIGHVADFCPICREKQAFELKRVGSASHVYYISAGEGELVGFERTCAACGSTYRADPAAYASVAKRPGPLSQLTAQTFPNFDQVFRDRIDLEARLRENPASISADERQSLIRTPFVFLSPRVEKRFASTHIDKEVGFSLLAALGLLVVGPGMARAVAPDSSDAAALVFLGAGVLLVGWQVSQSGGRFMRREILPLLAKSLRPLRPRDSELASVLAELKQLGHKMGRKVGLRELRAHLAQDAV